MLQGGWQQHPNFTVKDFLIIKCKVPESMNKVPQNHGTLVIVLKLSGHSSCLLCNTILIFPSFTRWLTQFVFFDFVLPIGKKAQCRSILRDGLALKKLGSQPKIKTFYNLTIIFKTHVLLLRLKNYILHLEMSIYFTFFHGLRIGSLILNSGELLWSRFPYL